MKKRILGLDLGTNSIGWALVEYDFENKEGRIVDLSSRIIPMSQDTIKEFGQGNTISHTATRTGHRSARKLYHRSNLRRDRLHRVLNILGFLPEHYAENIYFENNPGQFIRETKLNYRFNEQKERYEFIFVDSYQEMVEEFRDAQPDLFKDGVIKIPHDWTIYYLRKKALTQKINEKELSWVLLNFNQKRGYHQPWKEDNEQNQKEGTDKKQLKEQKESLALKEKQEQDLERSHKEVGEYIYGMLLKDPTLNISRDLVKTIERKYYKQELRAILKTQIKLHDKLRNRKLYQSCIEELYPKNIGHRNNIQKHGFDYLFVDDIIFYPRSLKSKKSTIANCQYEYRTYTIKSETNGELIEKRAPVKVISRSHPDYMEFRTWQFLHNLRIYRVIDSRKIDNTDLILKSEDDWCDLFDYLMDLKEIDQKKLLSYFSTIGVINKSDQNNYSWNYAEDALLPMNETRYEQIKRFKEVKGFDITKEFTREFQLHLWQIIYSIKDKTEYQKALRTFAIRYKIDIDSFVEQFNNHPSYAPKYGSYSFRAIKKLLPLMRMGRYWNEDDVPSIAAKRVEKIMERIQDIPDHFYQDTDELDKIISEVADDEVTTPMIKSFIPLANKNPLSSLNTYQACYAVYGRHSEIGEISKWHSPKDIDQYLSGFKQHSLRNPIVEQVVTETLRIVRDIWQYYGNGENNFFDEIHVELGRDLKNSAKKRKLISSKNKENELTNKRIKKLLQELQQEYSQCEIHPESPFHQELLKIYEDGVYYNSECSFEQLSEKEMKEVREKDNPTTSQIHRYRLWLEQGYASPYTGEIIPLSRLFTRDYEIDHIIPQSRFFNDTRANKVVCESEVNQLKGRQTGLEFIQKDGGTVLQVNRGSKTIKILDEDQYRSHCDIYFKKDIRKSKFLLMKDIPKTFTERQLNDTRYISKFVRSLLSNIVRENNEREAVSKNILTMPGSVTAKLKHDWGLHDKWNELIAPRFIRLNEKTNSSEYGYWDPTINTFRNIIPDKYASSIINKKRIDHRHHALDALVIACSTRQHIQYLNTLNAGKDRYDLRKALLTKNNTGNFTKTFCLPWSAFPEETKNSLEQCIITFKQNQRVINKISNYTWQWRSNSKGVNKKVRVKQTKGDGWAIRRELHKETIYGSVKIIRYGEKEVSLASVLNEPQNIIDEKIKIMVEKLNDFFDGNTRKMKAHLKEHPIIINDQEVSKVKTKVRIETKNATATRKPLSKITDQKILNSITDTGIRRILEKHLSNYDDCNVEERFEKAFSPEGIEELNRNITALNGGKPHQPIYKVRLYEDGNRFPVSNDMGSSKSKRYVETAKETNIFFAIYEDKNGKRQFETIPFREVMEYQKMRASKPREEMKKMPLIPVNKNMGKLLFTLSPNDLVFVPTEEEMKNPRLVQKELSGEQITQIYKMAKSSKKQCYFIPLHVAISIADKVEFRSDNRLENDFTGKSIKKYCWKLEVNRLGKITRIIKGSDALEND